MLKGRGKGGVDALQPGADGAVGDAVLFGQDALMGRGAIEADDGCPDVSVFGAQSVGGDKLAKLSTKEPAQCGHIDPVWHLGGAWVRCSAGRLGSQPAAQGPWIWWYIGTVVHRLSGFRYGWRAAPPVG